MTPLTAEEYGTPDRSAMGSASMSARSSTVVPGFAPRSTAVTELRLRPSVISSGILSSASSTLRWVRGRSSPISGSAWIDRRSSVSSAAIATASSYRPPTGHPPSRPFSHTLLVLTYAHKHLMSKPLPSARLSGLGEYGSALRADCIDCCKLPRGRVPVAAGTRGRQHSRASHIDEGRGSGREWRRLGYSPRPCRDFDRRVLRGGRDGAGVTARGPGARAQPSRQARPAHSQARAGPEQVPVLGPDRRHAGNTAVRRLRRGAAVRPAEPRTQQVHAARRGHPAGANRRDADHLVLHAGLRRASAEAACTA